MYDIQNRSKMQTYICEPILLNAFQETILLRWYKDFYNGFAQNLQIKHIKYINALVDKMGDSLFPYSPCPQ